MNLNEKQTVRIAILDLYEGNKTGGEWGVSGQS